MRPIAVGTSKAPSTVIAKTIVYILSFKQSMLQNIWDPVDVTGSHNRRQFDCDSILQIQSFLLCKIF